MKNNRIWLWLFIVCQAVILAGSIINPPSSRLLIVIYVLIPALLIIYFSLAAVGFFKNTKRRERLPAASEAPADEKVQK